MFPGNTEALADNVSDQPDVASRARGTIEMPCCCFIMETRCKIIGEGLRRMFKAVIGCPMGWDLIDAISHLEEREEALRDGRKSIDRPIQRSPEK